MSNWRTLLDQRAGEAIAEIRAMAESARRSIGQRHRWNKARAGKC